MHRIDSVRGNNICNGDLLDNFLNLSYLFSNNEKDEQRKNEENSNRISEINICEKGKIQGDNDNYTLSNIYNTSTW